MKWGPWLLIVIQTSSVHQFTLSDQAITNNVLASFKVAVRRNRAALSYRTIFRTKVPLYLRGGAAKVVRGEINFQQSFIDVRGVSHERAAALGDIARRAARREAKRILREDGLELESKPTLSSENGIAPSIRREDSSWLLNGTVCTPEQYRNLHGLGVKAFISKPEKQNRDESKKPVFKLLDPVQDLDRAPFSPEILKMIKSQGFLRPSPIQAQCWPYLIAKYDVVAVASTGSGKTCGYVGPLRCALSLHALRVSWLRTIHETE